MDEFLRFLWLHGTERASSELLIYAILLLMAIGSVIYSKILVLRDQDGLMAAMVMLLICSSLLLFSALWPNSPLIGVTGKVFPSPWSYGLFQSLCILCVVVSFVFGIVAGTLHSAKDVLQFLTYGISRWPWLILLAMLASLIFNE
ncbi:MAG: AbgT family transporter [Bacteroidaceae bacterium]|nr:AbgT family transporter [Bacteroidaceae bacterium]